MLTIGIPINEHTQKQLLRDVLLPNGCADCYWVCQLLMYVVTAVQATLIWVGICVLGIPLPYYIKSVSSEVKFIITRIMIFILLISIFRMNVTVRAAILGVLVSISMHRNILITYVSFLLNTRFVSFIKLVF